MKKIIVVGMSAASVAFVTKLRSFDKESEVICFSGESSAPYNRCLLADFLTGEIVEQQLHLKSDDFFTEHQITLKLNCWIIKIDTLQKRVYTEHESYSYDVLFLGMGTRPVIPPCIKKIPTSVQGVFSFHMLHDIEKINEFVLKNKPQSALVIGAGLNGIEAASSLMQLGIAVGIVEMNYSILPGQVDATVAEWIADKARHQGLGIFTGRKVTKVCYEQSRIVGVCLDSGTLISADMIVVAAGSQVNSEILHDAGIALQDGSVIVNKFMQTNVESVFAAGDLCIVPEMLTGKLVRSTTWSDAMLQGLCAATNFSSQPRSYLGIVGLRDSYFFGMDFYACGKTLEVDSTVEVIFIVQDKSLKKLFIKNEQLIGFVLIGDISKLSEYKKWYMTQVKIDRSLW